MRLQRSLGQRVSQTVSSVVTEYLLDVQPSLYRVLATDDGSNVSRFLHDRTGIHAQKDSAGNWDWMLKDGLGSVREVVDDNLNSLYTAQYAPYGEVWDTTGTEQTIFGYTGEPTDANDLVHLRARYYDPVRGVFNSRDPLETPNRYAYVGGNPINYVDLSGMDYSPPQPSGGCDQEDMTCPTSAPGWEGVSNTYGIRCYNNRTMFNPFEYSYPPTPGQLDLWWESLSETEKEIEYALAATNTDECRELAPFHNIVSFDLAMSWIMGNQAEINEAASQLRVEPALVAGILATEMLFDRTWVDVASDLSAEFGFAYSSGGGFGQSNAHYDARVGASEYVSGVLGITLDPRFTGDSLNDPDAGRFLTDDTNAILATAVVARWLVDPYTGNINVPYESPVELSLGDMAMIFSGYRGGVDGWSRESGGPFEDVADFRTRLQTRGLNCNAILALPVMEHMRNLFP